MNRYLKKFLICYFVYLSLAILGLIVFQTVRIVLYGPKIEYTLKPFERSIPGSSLKILFLGDSTAVGTGARENTQSIAGYFGKDFPRAHIVNISRNGQKIGELRRNFLVLTEPFDLIVIQIGGNDVLRFTSYKEIEKELALILNRARMSASHVIVSHSGNVGLSPVFSWPFNLIYTERSRKVRQIYLAKAEEMGAIYIDLFSERENDPFEKDIHRYYSPDYLHPSGDGYKLWYDTLRKTLDQRGVVLKKEE